MLIKDTQHTSSTIKQQLTFTERTKEQTNTHTMKEKAEGASSTELL